MPARPRLLLFPASLRRHSYQRRLVDYCAERLADACDLDLLGPDQVDLPLFNQDLEADAGLRQRLEALHARFHRADGLLVASPEYNGHVSPYLKNTVDWLSRLPRIDQACAAESAFRGKPLLLTSASTGWTGGMAGLRDARTVFAYLGCLVSAAQICVADAETWAESGAFRFEPPFTAHIDAVLADFITLVGRLAAAPAEAA